MEIHAGELAHLFGVERAEAVDEVDDVDRALGQHGQGLVQLPLLDRRDGHQVHRRLVALVVGVLDHVDGRGDLVDVGRPSDDVEDALVFRQDVVVVVASLGVSHGREFEIGGIVVDDPS